MADLQIVICENQLRHHGALDQATADAVRGQFRELFYPEQPAWRARALALGVETVERLLTQAKFL